jgi:hypothetical protein
VGSPFNPYEVLGIPRDADASTIKAAYRRRSMETHPDRGGPEAEFLDVVRAFQILSDAELRRRFDNTGDAGRVNPDNSDAVAWRIISECIGLILMQDAEPTPDINLVVTIRLHIEKGIAQIEEALKVHDRIQRRARELGPKFHRRGGDENNVIATIVRQRAVEAAEQRLKAEAALVRHRRAIALLGEYSFDVILMLVTTATQPQQSAMQGFSFRWGGL